MIMFSFIQTESISNHSCKRQFLLCSVFVCFLFLCIVFYSFTKLQKYQLFGATPSFSSLFVKTKQHWPRFPDSIILKDLRRLLRRVRLRRSAKIGVFSRLVLNCLLKIPPKKLLKKLLVGAKLNQSMPGKSITHHFISA